MTSIKLPRSSLKELYDKTKSVYDKKFNRYVAEWYKVIMGAASIGEFEGTLYVCDWDCEEGEVRQVVNDALDEIKDIFAGIKIEEDGDRYITYYNVSWDLDVLKASENDLPD